MKYEKKVQLPHSNTIKSTKEQAPLIPHDTLTHLKTIERKQELLQLLNNLFITTSAQNSYR